MKKENDEKSEALKIWSEIKDRKIEIFALPNQVVSNYYTQKNVEPTKCYLLAKAGSALPALEAVANEFKIELVDKFTVISRK